MTRAIVALCIVGLLAVISLGFSLPDGDRLSDRDMDALVGGTDSGWCLTCPNCEETVLCSEAEQDACEGKAIGDPCTDMMYETNGSSPETCSTNYGDQYCDPSSATSKDVRCTTEASCDCQEPPFGSITCTADDTSRVSYRTEIKQDSICGGGDPAPPELTSTDCE